MRRKCEKCKWVTLVDFMRCQKCGNELKEYKRADRDQPCECDIDDYSVYSGGMCGCCGGKAREQPSVTIPDNYNYDSICDLIS